MVEILSYLHQYVPMIEYTETTIVSEINETVETVEVPKASVYPIFIAGDQLTANRARNAIKAKTALKTNQLSDLKD